MFKVGIYRNKQFKNTIVLLFKDSKGFEINDGRYSDSWNSFNELDEDYEISEEIKKEILEKINKEEYHLEEQDKENIIHFLNPEKLIYKIVKKHLISSIGVIKIDDISSIEKVNGFSIKINLNGELRKIFFKDYEKLVKTFIGREIL